MQLSEFRICTTRIRHKQHINCVFFGVYTIWMVSFLAFCVESVTENSRQRLLLFSGKPKHMVIFRFQERKADMYT